MKNASSIFQIEIKTSIDIARIINLTAILRCKQFFCTCLLCSMLCKKTKAVFAACVFTELDRSGNLDKNNTMQTHRHAERNVCTSSGRFIVFWKDQPFLSIQVASTSVPTCVSGNKI